MRFLKTHFDSPKSDPTTCMDSLSLSTFRFALAASIHHLLHERKCSGTEQPEQWGCSVCCYRPKIELTIVS